MGGYCFGGLGEGRDGEYSLKLYYTNVIFYLIFFCHFVFAKDSGKCVFFGVRDQITRFYKNKISVAHFSSFRI